LKAIDYLLAEPEPSKKVQIGFSRLLLWETLPGSMALEPAIPAGKMAG